MLDANLILGIRRELLFIREDDLGLTAILSVLDAPQTAVSCTTPRGRFPNEDRIARKGKELLAMTRTITVTKIGKDDRSQRKYVRYRVEIAGSDQRTFEVRVPLTVVATKAIIKAKIEKLFSQGWLPANGAVHLMGNESW
jgi:hypothetical protein